MEKETIVKTNPLNTETLKVKGVNKKQLKILQNGKLPLAVLGGLIAGIGAQFAFANIADNEASDETEGELIDDTDFESSETSNNKEELFDFEAPTTIAFTDSVTDDMSFGEAFGTARSEMGPGGFFNWRGSSYHTLNKEEWDALSSEERDEYTQKILDNTKFQDGRYNKVEPDEMDDADVVPDNDKNSDDENGNDNSDDENKKGNSDDENGNDNSNDENGNDNSADENENDKSEGDNEEADFIIPENEQEFAELDEIISEEDLLDDLNKEVAFEEEEGSEGEIVEEENDNVDDVQEEESDNDFLEDLNDDSNNVEYDSDFGDDFVQGSDSLDEMDLDLD